MNFLYFIEDDHTQYQLDSILNLFTSQVHVEQIKKGHFPFKKLDRYDCLILQVSHQLLDDWEKHFERSYVQHRNWLLLFAEVSDSLIERSMHFFGVQHLFFVKHPFDQFRLAIDEIVKGNLYLDPFLMKRHFLTSQQTGNPNKTSSHIFSHRETQILIWLLKGYQQQVIANHLYLTKPMISQQLKQMRQKAGVQTNMELVAKAIIKGWVKEDDVPHLLS